MTDFTPKFEVAFDVDPADEPAGGEWVDLSTRLCDSAEWSLGTGRLTGGAEGTCTVVLDNHDRELDPTNPSATQTNLIPLRHARLTVTVGVTSYPLFRGFVDAWPPTMTGFDEWVNVNLVDGFAWCALQDADLDRPVEMSHERITALLDLAGWPAALRDIEDGVVELAAFEQSSANLLRSLEDAADAEGGDVFVAPDGKITFRSRHARLNATPAITIGTGGTAFAAATPAWDTAWLTNIARVELDDGRVFETIDDTSVTKYGPRVMPTRDLALRAAEAEAVGQWEVKRFAEPHLWLDRVIFESAETGALAAVLPRRVGHLVTTTFTPQHGDAFSEVMAIERVSGTMSAAEMTVTLDLAPHFDVGDWLILDDDVTDFGYLDLNRLGP